jgi:hypothetical protein
LIDPSPEPVTRTRERESEAKHMIAAEWQNRWGTGERESKSGLPGWAEMG